MRIFLLLFLIICSCLKIQAQTTAQQVVPGLVVVKIDESMQGRSGSDANRLSSSKIEALPAVARSQSIKELSAIRGRNTTSVLDGIFKVELNDTSAQQELIQYFKSFSNVIYAEPYQNVRPLVVPNDPEATIGAEQYYLEQIRAYQAWDISSGDENIIIGILDTGADLDHEDLQANLYTNDADPIDGIDNDLDGYTDNYYGWDFADGDNDPTADGNAHGTGVSGIAAAATNNATGIAGMGFNTKFMPIKIFRSTDGFSRNSYEAIIYAADKGCDVINLSWGGIGNYSQYAQDVINYAVFERDVVVVAAAGNTDDELEFYPASYQNVLSVSWVGSDDVRSPNATYSDFVDLVAPGVGVYTTQNNDTYQDDSGSSYAAPLVSGTAALVRAVHPEWNARQVMEQIRVSTNDIYSIPANESFEFKLGKGRLNAFRALADYNSPAIRIADFNYNNGLEQAAYFGDTLSISIDFENLLSAAEGVQVTLVSSSPYVEILDGDFFIASLNTLQTTSNASSPFKIKLSEDLPENEDINFRLLFEGENYSDYQAFQIQSSPAIRIFSFGDWQFGYSATGTIGRNFQYPFSNFIAQYKGKPVLNHMGYVLASPSGNISKNTAINPSISSYTQYFTTAERLKRYDDISADLDIRNAYNEKDTVTNPLDVRVEQRLLGWNDLPNGLLLNYRIINNTTDYDSLYFQWFSDFFVAEYGANKLAYDTLNKMSYAYNVSEDQYFGIAVLGSHDSLFNALDIGTLNGHTSDLANDTLTNAILNNLLENPFSKTSAGELSGGNNVGGLQGVLIKNFLSSTVYELEAALLQGTSLTELQNALESIKQKSDQAKRNPPLGFVQEVCFNDEPVIDAQVGESWRIYENPLDESPIYEGTAFSPGQITEDTTFYRIVINSKGVASRRDRLEIRITDPIADFTVPDAPLLLEEGSKVSYRFIDQSENAESWSWNFNNGYESTNQNPLTFFDTEGTFTIELSITNAIGCASTVSKNVEVALKGRKPQIQDTIVCLNASYTLTDLQLSEIVVYTDSTLNNQVYQGESITIEGILNDTILYIRNELETYPSSIETVEIKVADLKAAVSIEHSDTAQNDSSGIILTNNSAYEESVEWYIDNELFSTSESVTVSPIQLQKHEIKLVANGAYGCTDSFIIDQSPSPNPQFENYFLCNENDVSIQATNTDNVYYYADSSLTNFLGKGSQLRIQNISDTLSVYAVNVANYMPSAVVQVPLLISNVTASFSMSADTINLAYQEEIELEADVANEAFSYVWDFGNGDTSTSSLTTARYNEAGVFSIKLVVEDSLLCRKEEQMNLVVFNDPFLGNADELKSFFKVYPNPARKFINLEARKDFDYDAYEIKDLKGKTVIKSQSSKPRQQAEVISIEKLESGPYILVVKKDSKEANFMFIKR